MIGDAREHLAQVGLRIQAVQLRRTDQAVDRRGAFAGSDGGAARWAVVASLLATAKLNGIEPFAYLKDVLQRLSDGHPMNGLDELLPWNWASSIAAAA